MTSSRLTSKLSVVLLALVGAAVLLVGAGRVWVSGTVNDAVLGASRISGTGSEVASGVVALALVGAAAALASATSGALVRRVTLVVLALAGAAECAVAARVALSPASSLGAIAAKAAGRTGSLETHATASAWPVVCVVAALMLVLAAVAGWVGAVRWRGLGARYETPSTSAGARGQRVATDWDRLDAGDDPTLRDPSAGT
ncbi:putative membrane protein (TIGR02234 family) [Phycicoccus badiiscoriae]|uniref:Putative membrane protein (TIGR02234 family) n=1 Tax=Pedococcus badiiscoriae TaxID=642776 RepID=A0A852WHS8_9MICO|nr:putative membrane protein (TIGR02234 family) [Pedococcus badiiscoriae]